MFPIHSVVTTQWKYLQCQEKNYSVSSFLHMVTAFEVVLGIVCLAVIAILILYGVGYRENWKLPGLAHLKSIFHSPHPLDSANYVLPKSTAPPNSSAGIDRQILRAIFENYY